MTNIRCIVVDDEPLAVDLLADYLQKTPGMQLVLKTTHVLDALHAVQEGKADFGFGNSITFPMAAGATAVLMPGRPDPEAVFATIERHRPTVFFGVPTLYVAMAAHAGSEGRDLSSVRLCVSAAETLSSTSRSTIPAPASAPSSTSTTPSTAITSPAPTTTSTSSPAIRAS